MPTPVLTCNLSTVGGITATPTDGTCRATLPPGAPLQQFLAFIRECERIPGGKVACATCTFPSTSPT
ncbi:MAG TPA: hypothetical protein VI278_01670 [Nitrososphaeraceae archaeon]